MIVTVFRSRLREDMGEGLDQLGARMYELATQMPGFVSYKDYQAEDGEVVTVVQFESEETLLAWRNHPEHVEAQQKGRDLYFSSYHIQVCKALRDYRWPV